MDSVDDTLGKLRERGVKIVAEPFTSALLPRWRDAAASGHADDDLSAVYLFS